MVQGSQAEVITIHTKDPSGLHIYRGRVQPAEVLRFCTQKKLLSIHVNFIEFAWITEYISEGIFPGLQRVITPDLSYGMASTHKGRIQGLF